MKRTLTLLLAAAMLFGAFACTAVAETTELEPVTLRWVTMGADKQPDHDEVLAAFNERLAAVLPNTTLVLEPYSDFDVKWPLFIAAGEEMDIAWSGYAFDVLSEILKEEYLPLDDLIAQYAPNLQAEQKIWEYEYTTMMWDGVTYGIPLVQPYIQESRYLNIPEELLSYIDYEKLLTMFHDNVHSTREMYELIDQYFEAVYAAELPGTGTISPYISSNIVIAMNRFEAFDNVSSSAIGYFPFDEPLAITCLYASEDYKLWCEFANKWYQKGYIREDVLTAESSDSVGTPVMRAWDSENWNAVDEEIGLRRVASTEATESNTVHLLVDKPANKWNGATKIGYSETYTTIPYTSANPERAMMLMDLLHATEGEGYELYNLLCYGFEGKHYDFTNEEKTRIQAREYLSQGDSNSAYGQWNWVLGNNYNAYQTPNLVEGQVEYARGFSTDVKTHWFKTPVFGMVVDNSKIDMELAQVSAVWNEYIPALKNGVSDDWQVKLDEMMTKAYAAGLQTIIDEWQAQADAYAAK